MARQAHVAARGHRAKPRVASRLLNSDGALACLRIDYGFDRARDPAGRWYSATTLLGTLEQRDGGGRGSR